MKSFLPQIPVVSLKMLHGSGFDARKLSGTITTIEI